MDTYSVANADFPPGFFTPTAQLNGLWQRLLGQIIFEARLLLRNLEQIFLTMIVPIALLIIAITVNVSNFSRPANIYVPVIIGFSIMSVGFTGQAIAVGFDRRYGALYCLGASPLPRWCVIAAKSISTLIAVIGQIIIESIIGVFLGYRPDINNIILLLLCSIIGTVCFAALGLLLGGTLRAEIVLALANLLWFVFAAISAEVLYSKHSSLLHTICLATPPGALTSAMHASAQGNVALGSYIVLGLWSLGAIVLGKRYFSFR